MFKNIIRYAYGKNIMESEVTYQCSLGKDTLYMYMTN
jgi:hypothetical protein